MKEGFSDGTPDGADDEVGRFPLGRLEGDGLGAGVGNGKNVPSISNPGTGARVGCCKEGEALGVGLGAGVGNGKTVPLISTPGRVGSGVCGAGVGCWVGNGVGMGVGSGVGRGVGMGVRGKVGPGELGMVGAGGGDGRDDFGEPFDFDLNIPLIMPDLLPPLLIAPFFPANLHSSILESINTFSNAASFASCSSILESADTFGSAASFASCSSLHAVKSVRKPPLI